MTEILLIRHAVNDYVKTGKLAGWTPAVHLNDDGRAQALALGQRLANTKLDAIYASPLERTVETAQAVLEHHPALTLQLLEEVGEVRYGDWQGAELSKLYRRKQWLMVQAFPSRMRFPNGETMREAQMRMVNALEVLVERHPRQRIAVVSHADLIKLVLAYYIGTPIDLFQRLNISPASLSVINIGYGRIVIGQVNETSYLPAPTKPDGSTIELRQVHGLMVEALGDPGSRIFYFQVQHDDAQRTTLRIEKAQALLLAEEIDRLLSTDDAIHDEPTGAEIALQLINPEPALFRGGKIDLQYEENTEFLRLEITELLGAEQGTPRTLKVWSSAAQLRALGKQARAVVQRGRSE